MPTWNPPHTFQDGVDQVASGDEVMEMFEYVRDYIAASLSEGGAGAVAEYVMESDSTAVQTLTTSFVTLKNIDGTDVQFTPTDDQRYEIILVMTASKAADTINAPREVNAEVRAGSTVLGKTVECEASGGPSGGMAEELVMENVGPYRTQGRIGTFVSDGTAVKLYVKCASTTDTPQIERDHTYVVFREVETAS